VSRHTASQEGWEGLVGGPVARYRGLDGAKLFDISYSITWLDAFTNT
jgi:hypothetical protein